ncbi:MAG: glycosyltransferase family 87 protein, partial [Leptolinea sp.]
SIGLPYFLNYRKKLPSFAWFLFATSLFSYGLLFEIERGQFNLIAMGFAFLAILLFHKIPRLRWLAYIFFCISVQLKIYPAIFVIFLTDDWRDWKRTFLRWASLGLANIALLFLLGLEIMQHYVTAMTRVVSSIGKSDWSVNHSINGFVSFINYYFNFPDTDFQVIQSTLTVTIIILIGICFYNAFVRRTILDPFLLLASTIGALLFPTLSNDYTLAYLVGPTIFLLIHLDEETQRLVELTKKDKSHIGIIIGLCAFALTSTYFSYLQKPLFLQNQLPALFLLLVCTTIYSFKNRYPANVI